MNEHDQELGSQYLEGSLSPAEMKDFEARLAQDQELANQFNDLRAAYLAVNIAGFEDLRNRISKIGEGIHQQKKQGPNRTLRPLFLAAAGFILVATLSIFFLMKRSVDSPEELFASNFSPYRAPAALRAAGDPSETEWKNAVSAYTENRFENAATSFQKYLDTHPNDLEARFYAGISLLAQGNKSDSARKLLEEVQEVSSPLQEQATWYLALCHIQEGNLQKAKPLLQTLSSDPDAYNSGRAKKLLDSL